MKNIDKYRGCLIGGAAGDALGYAVEFMQEYEIFEQYGKGGITEYSLDDGVALISDDTQMSLFTAIGLLIGTTREMMRGNAGTYPFYISFAYKDWLKTQLAGNGETSISHSSWLNNVPELNNRRAPGSTCLSACMQKEFGTIEKPINNSKGCGGVMRVAPIGIYLEDKGYSIEDIDMIGAETAALTHGHPLGYIPAAALVHIIHLVSHNTDISLLDAVQYALRTIKTLFGKTPHFSEFEEIMQKSITLSQTDIKDIDAIYKLGEGWVAEETLAIAVYCALKYSNDFEKAVIASVNHSGDSDSTGAVTGNILGAYLGLSAIPQKFIYNLECIDIITEVADDLYNDCQMSEYGSHFDEKWVKKYVDLPPKYNGRE